MMKSHNSAQPSSANVQQGFWDRICPIRLVGTVDFD